LQCNIVNAVLVQFDILCNFGGVDCEMSKATTTLTLELEVPRRRCVILLVSMDMLCSCSTYGRTYFRDDFLKGGNLVSPYGALTVIVWFSY